MPVMHGPMISNPAKIEERNISDNDVEAYKAAGWVLGAKVKDEKAADFEVPVSTETNFEKTPNESATEAPAPKKKRGSKKAK